MTTAALQQREEGTMRGVMRGIRYIVVVLVLVGAFAGRAHAVMYGQYYDYVYKISVRTDNYLWINVIGNFSTSHGCSQPWYVRSLYDLTDARTKAWQQVAMASLLSHTKVYIETDGCTVAGYPIMIALQIERE